MNKFDELIKSLQELVKKVREPSIGSPASAENPPTVEGAAKPMKHRGGDPRKGQGENLTGGASELRNQGKNGEYTRNNSWNKQGTKVDWVKSNEEEQEICKIANNGQWSIKNLEKATHERVANPTEVTLDRANKLKEMHEKAVYGHRNIPEAHLPKEGESKEAHQKRVVSALKTKFPNVHPDKHLGAANAAWAHANEE